MLRNSLFHHGWLGGSKVNSLRGLFESVSRILTQHLVAIPRVRVGLCGSRRRLRLVPTQESWLRNFNWSSMRLTKVFEFQHGCTVSVRSTSHCLELNQSEHVLLYVLNSTMHSTLQQPAREATWHHNIVLKSFHSLFITPFPVFLHVIFVSLFFFSWKTFLNALCWILNRENRGLFHLYIAARHAIIVYNHCDALIEV